jgi:hypothetical protein
VTVHVAQVEDDRSGRAHTWLHYRGDKRNILTPEANPLYLGPTVATVFGSWSVPLPGTMRGPTTNGEALFPVIAMYDDAQDTTDVGWSYAGPPEQPS